MPGILRDQVREGRRERRENGEIENYFLCRFDLCVDRSDLTGAV